MYTARGLSKCVLVITVVSVALSPGNAQTPCPGTWAAQDSAGGGWGIFASPLYNVSNLPGG